MNKRIKLHKNQKGFTIIELMISTVIFTIILLICIQGMVQVSRAYYKGLTYSRTQEATRQLVDEITDTIKLSGSNITKLDPANAGPTIAPTAAGTATGTGVFCAGNKKYTYALDRQVVNGATNHGRKEIRNAIISEEQACSDVLLPSDLNADVSAPNRSLLPENMRLTKFNIVPVVADSAVQTKSGSSLWRVEISVIYGDQDLLATDNDANPYIGTYIDDFGNLNDRVLCRPGTGDEFCSIVELSTIVSRRIA